jgi:hypothetical protein
LSQKLQNFAVKSNSEKRFTFVQKLQNVQPINKRKLTKTAKIFHSWLANELFCCILNNRKTAIMAKIFHLGVYYEYFKTNIFAATDQPYE